MSATSVRLAIAMKLSTLTHAAHVYSALGDGALVAPWPQELTDDGPHGVVRRAPTSRTGGTGRQFIDRTVDCEWRLSALDLAAAEATIDLLEDEIVTAFSSGITLGGLVIECLYTGSDQPQEVEEDGRSWLLWVTHFSATERVAIAMSA